MKWMLRQAPHPWVLPQHIHWGHTHLKMQTSVKCTFLILIGPRSSLVFCPSSPMLNYLTQLSTETCKMLIGEKQTQANTMSNTFHLSMELITVESKLFPIFSSQRQIKLLTKHISTPLLPQWEKSVQNICLILVFIFLFYSGPGRRMPG